MNDRKAVGDTVENTLLKARTGIRGFDEITGGGLPKGRPTLVTGGPGCGKTLFGMEFLVRGATRFDEPGVFVSFEETEMDLVRNVKSLGFDLQDLAEREKLIVDYVHIERREIMETGEYDLEGLFVRLADAIDTIGAKRVVMDTLEALFAGFPNESILRAEIRRLFRWLKERGVTAVITAEKGKDTLTRHGLEEYISDCVILLDHRVTAQVSTRRFRIVKYRGSMHGTNEYPFLIDDEGITILPITSVGLDYKVSTERISSGIPRLDAMLGGEGFFRGSSILVSGTSGTGKTSIAACFADAVCGRGETCLYFAFEESRDQIVRNMRSIGLDLDKWIQKDLLRIHAARPTAYGLETHLVGMHKFIREIKPSVVIVDPVSNLITVGDTSEVKLLLMRMVDIMKQHGITSLFTSLVGNKDSIEMTDIGVSSLMDTWVLVRDLEIDGERNRGIYIIKSRGMTHSNQVREFLLTGRGVELVDVYVGPGGVLTGAARATQEAREREEALARQQDVERRLREIERRRKVREARIAALQAESEAEEEEMKRIALEEKLRNTTLVRQREEIALLRKADAASETDAPEEGGERP